MLKKRVARIEKGGQRASRSNRQKGDDGRKSVGGKASRSLRKQQRDNLPRENIALCFAREYYYIQAGIIQQDEDAEWRN